MASLQHDFESTLNLGSDSDDAYVTEIAEEDIDHLTSKIIRHLSESKKSACIVHKEGQPAKLVLTLGKKNAKSSYTTSLRSRPTKKLIVKNVPTKSDREHLQMFFEYEKGQGGGPVKEVTLNDDRSAIIEFEEARSVDIVLQKAPIKMLGEKVDVKAFVPYLNAGEIINSIYVDGIPISLSREVVPMGLEPEKIVKRDLKRPDPYSNQKASEKLEHKKAVQKPFKVGDRVRLKASVDLSWSSYVTHESIGTLKEFCSGTNMFVDFPNHSGWLCSVNDIELVD